MKKHLFTGAHLLQAEGEHKFVFGMVGGASPPDERGIVRLYLDPRRIPVQLEEGALTEGTLTIELPEEWARQISNELLSWTLSISEADGQGKFEHLSSKKDVLCLLCPPRL